MEADTPASHWPAPGQHQADLSMLERALRERSGYTNVASLCDVYHLAQRRHGYRGSVQEAAQALEASGRWRVTQSTCMSHRMVEPADKPPAAIAEATQGTLGDLHHG